MPAFSTMALIFSLHIASQGQAAPVTDCDRLATNPMDPAKVTQAVAYEDMDADKAIAACSEQMKSYPQEARFKYMFGRALYKKHQDNKLALIKKVKPILEEASMGGSSMASHTLGVLYRDGALGKQNFAKAKTYFEQAGMDIPLAAYFLGEMYSNKLVQEEDNEAMRWYGVAADGGHTDARFIVGRAMLMSNDPQWTTQGYLMLQPLTETGHVGSLLLLADVLLSDDNPEGVNYMRKAADLGHVEAQLIVSNIYRTGEIVEKNPHLALKYLLRAIEAGRKDYINTLISLYMNEPSLGSEAARGMEMVKWAQKEGSWETIAFIGDLYFREKYGLYGESEAKKWYNKAISLAPDTPSPSENDTLIYLKSKIRFLEYADVPDIRTVSDDELIRIFQQIKTHRGHKPTHEQSSLSTSIQFYASDMEFWTKLDTLMGAKKLQSNNLSLSATVNRKTQDLFYTLSPRGGSGLCDAGLARKGLELRELDAELDSSDGTVEQSITLRTSLFCKPVTPITISMKCWVAECEECSEKDSETKDIKFNKGQISVTTNWYMEYAMTGDQALAYYDHEKYNSYRACRFLD